MLLTAIALAATLAPAPRGPIAWELQASVSVATEDGKPWSGGAVQRYESAGECRAWLGYWRSSWTPIVVRGKGRMASRCVPLYE